MEKRKEIISALTRQARRRGQAEFAQKKTSQRFLDQRQEANKLAMRAQHVRDERTRRRQDYEAGVLVPRRDIGTNAEKYGTMDMTERQSFVGYPDFRWKDNPIMPGDRVVILKGKDKGKIGRVSERDKKNGVTVAGLNQGDFFIPEYMRIEHADTRKVAPISMPLPPTDVKLVVAIKNPATGHLQDVIVDKIELRGQRRYIPGLNTLLPPPEGTTGNPNKDDDTPNDDDTLRIELESETQRPYLLQPPMPPSVIDELRNRYSRFRTRHDEEFIARQEARVQAAERKKELARLVSTPMMELRAREVQRGAESSRELSEEQLARIGEVMARERMSAARRVARGEQ